MESSSSMAVRQSSLSHRAMGAMGAVAALEAITGRRAVPLMVQRARVQAATLTWSQPNMQVQKITPLPRPTTTRIWTTEVRMVVASKHMISQRLEHILVAAKPLDMTRMAPEVEGLRLMLTGRLPLILIGHLHLIRTGHLLHLIRTGHLHLMRTEHLHLMLTVNQNQHLAIQDTALLTDLDTGTGRDQLGTEEARVVARQVPPAGMVGATKMHIRAGVTATAPPVGPPPIIQTVAATKIQSHVQAVPTAAAAAVGMEAAGIAGGAVVEMAVGMVTADGTADGIVDGTVDGTAVVVAMEAGMVAGIAAAMAEAAIAIGMAVVADMVATQLLERPGDESLLQEVQGPGVGKLNIH